MKPALLAGATVLFGLTPISQSADAFSFGGNRAWSTGFRSGATRGMPSIHATGKPAIAFYGNPLRGKNRIVPFPNGAPMAPLPMPPSQGEPLDDPQMGRDTEQQRFTPGLSTPVIRIESIADVPLRFSIVSSNGEPCITQSINPGRMISLPVCGAKITWHDGRNYENMAVQPMRIYRFEWKASKWAVEDVSSKLY